MANDKLKNFTKTNIVNSLRKKMVKKDLDCITIQEIVDECEISRHTFYYHFSDIYDAVKWMYKQDAIDMINQSCEIKNWKSSMINILKLVDNNSAMYKCTLNSRCAGDLHKFCYEIIYASLVNEIEQIYHSQGIKANQKFSHFVAHSYSLSIVTMIQSWLFKEIDYPMDSLIRIMNLIVFSQINEIVLNQDAILQSSDAQ